MGRKTVTIPRGTRAREAIQIAKKADKFTAAPSAKRKGASGAGGLPREPGPDEDTDTALANKAAEIFNRDTRSDEPGAGVEIEDFIPEPDLVKTAEGEAGPGERVIVTKTGRVEIRSPQGRIVRVVGTGARDPETGRFVSAQALAAGKARERRVERVEENALRRVVAISKSLFQSSGGASPARLRAMWRGYKEAHPEAKGNLVVEGSTAHIISGGKRIASTKVGRKKTKKEADE